MNREFDIIVYGATGFTGRLVVEHLARRYPAGSALRWAMAGRSLDKLAEIRDRAGAHEGVALIVADAQDTEALRAMAGRARIVLCMTGPYQLHGSAVVAACAAAGTDYLDINGEPVWMREMIDAHDAQAKASGARILFSCGFDSIPFELGTWFCQQQAIAVFGAPAPLIKARVSRFRGPPSGGSVATGMATMASLERDPSQLALLGDPFALTPGHVGASQGGHDADVDPDVGPVAPFMMEVVNSKNVHRSNFLLGEAYGKDFVYDEKMMVTPDVPEEYTNLEFLPTDLKPGDGPDASERAKGFYEVLLFGVASDGRRVKVAVGGHEDPGYASTSKMISETALCLLESQVVPGGCWVPGAALRGELVKQLEAHAGMYFQVCA